MTLPFFCQTCNHLRTDHTEGVGVCLFHAGQSDACNCKKFVSLFLSEYQAKGSDSMLALLTEIMAILGTLGNNATVQKILACIVTSSGWPAILTCITGGVIPNLPVGSPDHVAATQVVDKIKVHLAASSPP